MNKNTILENLLQVAQQPFLRFAYDVEEKTDNAFETLNILATEENVTAGRLAEVLDIKPSSVTQIIKKLVEAGTVVREKSPTDSRVTLVKITDKGRESLQEHGAIATTLRDVLFAEFSETELTELNTYLKRMNDNLNSPAFQEKLIEVFGDDERWDRFNTMSAHFGRAREQLINRSGFNGFGGFGGFGGGRPGFDGGRPGFGGGHGERNGGRFDRKHSFGGGPDGHDGRRGFGGFGGRSGFGPDDMSPEDLDGHFDEFDDNKGGRN